MSRSSISVTIITLNEQKNIRRCLESVNWADEIVVVDCGSSDDTISICEEYGARVFKHNWKGYAEQKNWAIEQATGDWILSLDADEEVTPELACEIEVVLSSENPADAYSIPRRNLFLGRWMRHGGWYPDYQLRLFRRGRGTFKLVPLHECIVIHGKSVRIDRLKSNILHHTYPSVHEFIERMDRYTTIEGQSVATHNIHRAILAVRILIAFPLKFAEVYVWKCGWRDGFHGFIAAMFLAARKFFGQVKLWERFAQNPPD